MFGGSTMARSTLLCLAFVSTLVFHISHVCASIDEFLQTLNTRYQLDEDPGLQALLDELEPALEKYEEKSVEEALRNDEGRKAFLSFFAGCLQIGAKKESNTDIKNFFLELLSSIEDGRLEAVLKDPAQWSVLAQYLKTWGKSKVPSAFVSGTVQTAGFTSVVLVTCSAMSLALT